MVHSSSFIKNYGVTSESVKLRRSHAPSRSWESNAEKMMQKWRVIRIHQDYAGTGKSEVDGISP